MCAGWVEETPVDERERGTKGGQVWSGPSDSPQVRQPLDPARPESPLAGSAIGPWSAPDNRRAIQVGASSSTSTQVNPGTPGTDAFS